VPEPDISLHFLIQLLKILNQAQKSRIQELTSSFTGLPVRQDFSSKIIGLGTLVDTKPKPQFPLPKPVRREIVAAAIAA
jgi:hypothetical protein